MRTLTGRRRRIKTSPRANKQLNNKIQQRTNQHRRPRKPSTSNRFTCIRLNSPTDTCRLPIPKTKRRRNNRTRRTSKLSARF